MTVHAQAVRVVLELPGRTSASPIAQVRARVDGIVLEREFKEGSYVKARQPLYRIDPAPYEALLVSKANSHLSSNFPAHLTAAHDRRD